MVILGCDPEFVLEYDGKFLPAHKILSVDGDFSTDGDTSIGELRPMPGYSTLELISNIKVLIKDSIEEIPLLKNEKISLLSGHFKHKPIGGHIHLSSPFITEDIFSQLYEKLELILQTLSDLIDNKDEKELRKREGYGRGYRIANHGGMEYRSPGSWLLHIKVAYANLFLAEVTTKEFIKKNEKIFERFKERKEISENISLIKFIEESTIEKEIKVYSIKIFEELFKNIPLKWDEDFKRGWI